MWYLITFGAGLLVGLGFLIWALRERSLRHTAERERDAAKEQQRSTAKKLEAVKALVEQLQVELKQARDGASALRLALQEAQKRLLECNDPATVKAWLDEELAKTNL